MNGRIGSSLTLLVALFAGLGALGVVRADDDAGKTEDMAARGRVTYRSFCASCHGATGKGDGSVAEVLTTPPADLTRIQAENGGTFPVERVREYIDGRAEVAAHGRRDMPVWGDALQVVGVAGDEAEVEQKIAELVAYLESIQVEE